MGSSWRLSPSKRKYRRSGNKGFERFNGLNNIFTEQVKTFGDIGRHPLGRVFTISHYSLLRIDEYDLSPTNKNNSPSSYSLEAKWHNVNRIGELAFDHNKIFAACKEKLIKNVKSKPVGLNYFPISLLFQTYKTCMKPSLKKSLIKEIFEKK